MKIQQISVVYSHVAPTELSGCLTRKIMSNTKEQIVYQSNNFADLYDNSFLRRLRDLSIGRIGIVADLDKDGYLLMNTDDLVNVADRCRHSDLKVDVISIRDGSNNRDMCDNVVRGFSEIISLAQELEVSLIRWETALLEGLDS